MKEKKIINIIRSLRVAILIIVTIWVLVMYIFSISIVRHKSMQETLFDGDVIFVDKLFDYTGGLKRGDIIVLVEERDINSSFFRRAEIMFDDYLSKFSRERNNTRLVKRIVARGGDKVDIIAGELYVNDVKINEPYVNQMTGKGTLNYPITVDDDCFFVLGDNREISRDSRTFGLIDKTNIEGKVVFRLFPIFRFGSLIK